MPATMMTNVATPCCDRCAPGRARPLLTMMLVAGLGACGDSAPTPPTPVEPANRAPVAVGSIAALELAIGDTLTLNVASYFTDPDGDALTYSASVSGSGVASAAVAGAVVTIRALGEGGATLTVTASDGNLSASQEAALTAFQPNRSPVTVDSIPAVDFAVGDSISLNVAPYFNDADGDSLTYAASVSDSTVASASVAGAVVTIRALGEGGATLTVTASDGTLTASQEAALTVLPRSPVGRVTIGPDNPRVFGPAEEAQFVAAVFATTGLALPEAAVEWSSSAPWVATVSSEGVVATVAEGIATIAATSDTVSGSVRVIVGPPAIRREYEALRAIYEQLGGSSWKESTNWTTNEALDTWSRVQIDRAGFVTQLQLDQNNLSGTLPAEIGALTRLKRLDMDLNWDIVGPIPAEIGDLESLEFLKLSSTGISGPVPSEIGKLANLEELLLHFTQLTSIPPEIGDLTNLWLLHGFLSKFEGPLPATIGNLQNLRDLWINGNRFSGAIPPEIGGMAALEKLHLHDNDFSGAIPTRLADAPKLSVLRLSGNRLSGQLPSELGKAPNLRWLALDRNELSGPLPTEVGDWTNLETLELQENGFSGPIPPELGGARSLVALDLSRNQLTGLLPGDLAKLNSLERLSLSNNRGLTGTLPAELTGMRSLRVLLLGGTDLCAPTDPQYLRWLDGLPNAHVKRCVSTDASTAYLTQAVQSMEYPVPLIAGDSALLRVFVVSEKGSGANGSIPPARATFYRGGTELHVVDLDGASGRIPASLDEADLNLSLNAMIPGSVVQPGLEMVVEIDPGGTLDQALGVSQRLPEAGRTPIRVEAVAPYELTLITFLWTERPDSALLAKVNGLGPDSPLLWATREFLPVNEINVVHRDPIWLDENPSADIMVPIIHATLAAREAAGGRGHWVGVWSGCCGLASPGHHVAAVGLEPTAPDRFWQNNNVLAHEIGHLMTLPHAPCNVPDPDPSFPYPNGQIGSWGYDMRAHELRSPESPEFMSYCGEEEKWVSGFYHAQALGWRLGNNASASRPGPPVSSLMLWGGVSPDGELALEPAFVLDAVPTPFVHPGPYRIAGRDRQGREVFSYSVAMSPLEDVGGSAFALMVPVEPQWETNLYRIELTGPEGRAEILRDGPTTSVLLTDPRTGQIRGFLRRGLDVAAFAEGTRSSELLRAIVPESGLVASVSRGIPAAESWRR